ncbi:hypothetical protein HZA41_01165 [Candidatus Peregrinibacteria bacterium]|nr:hypothetical protein [Candidatus Peregrinibacteria bacterium]
MFTTHKKNLPSARTIIIAIYIALSLLYIIVNLWINFKNNVIQWSYLNGKQTLIQEILTSADETKCQPFTVFLKEEKVELVNTKCLQTAANQNSAEPEAEPSSPANTAENASE